MAKMLISRDEWYPVYSLEESSSEYDYYWEVDDELVNEWNDVMKRFELLQVKIKELGIKQGKKRGLEV